jgi:hypothetical protein
MKNLKYLASACILMSSNILLTNDALALSNYGNNQQQVGQQVTNTFSEAELAQMLAPIALYPDSLLTHILIASTYPLELVQAQRWREENQHLDPAYAVELAEKEGWDPSVTALVAFDSVLERLNDDLQWTQDLGNAFLEDETQVLDAIQDLRQHAQRAKTLKNLENMRVTKVNQQIVIEPIRQEVIYVPYYDTRVVYGNWHWRRYPPVYWDIRPHVSINFSNRHSSHFAWHAGININFNYFFSAFNWQHRHVVVTRHHKSHYYRPHHRISRSHGAQRWQHKVAHRRGVAYRSDKVRTRFYGNAHHKRSNTLHRQHKQEHYAHTKKRLNKHYANKHRNVSNKLNRQSHGNRYQDAKRNSSDKRRFKDARYKDNYQSRAKQNNDRHNTRQRDTGYKNRFDTNTRRKDGLSQQRDQQRALQQSNERAFTQRKARENDRSKAKQRSAKPKRERKAVRKPQKRANTREKKR